jgi:CRISPR-associated protein Cas4
LFLIVSFNGTELVSVSDLTTYTFCKRKLWLSRKAKIESGKIDWNPIVKYRVLRSLINLVDLKDDIHSLTDFMCETLNEISGEIVDTEVYLKREKLCGRIDVLRKTDEGYIIQEEKSSVPPKGKIAWESDLLQVDAYAFLLEGSSKYSPIIGGIIIYNDLKPREVKPDPERAKEILEKVVKLLENNDLPEAEGNVNKCISCSYYPLCQVLPQEGGLKSTEIKGAFATRLSPKEIIRDY